MVLFKNFGRVILTLIGGNIRGFSKGYILRRCIPVWLLLTLLFFNPNTAYSQTRFFERGDSGFTGSWGYFSEVNNLGYHDTGARASYTHKGLFDVGFGIGYDDDDKDFKYAIKGLFANVVLYRPRGGADIGLEAKGQYSAKTTSLSWPDPRFEKFEDSTFQTGLRGFFHHPFGSKSGMILSLGAYYRFNKHQVLDIYDEVSFGHDYGEFGFASDLHFLVWGFAHLSIGVQYAQDNSYIDKWEFGGLLSFGILIGRSSGQDGVNHD